MQQNIDIRGGTIQVRSEKKKSEVKGFGNFDLLVPGTKRDAKKYEWLHRIAEVNELARPRVFHMVILLHRVLCTL